MEDAEPRPHTQEEVRKMFLDEVRSRTHCWYQATERTVEDRIYGAVFSVLSILDGSSNLPKFIVAADPHPEDRTYSITEGENYFPDSTPNPNDISGSLHEGFYK